MFELGSVPRLATRTPVRDIRRTDVGGIPTFVGPSVDGVYAGGLVFRVGYADETLVTRGLTHLTEHLALAFSDFTKVHTNGATASNTTSFYSSGTLDEVVNFLNTLVVSLAAMPLERLESEKSILGAEANGRSWGPAPDMFAWRHGTRGYGLASFNELGLSRLTATDVEAWVAKYFVRANAALWLATDEVPAGLKLDLLDGDRQPLPIVTSALPEMPASYEGRDGVIVLESVVARSSTARLFTSVFEQALYRELRLNAGLSYTVSSDYEPLDADVAYLRAMADALPEKQDAMVRGFIDVLTALRAGQISTEDFAAAVSKARRDLEHPDIVTHLLPGSAVNELLGSAYKSVSQLAAELDVIAVDDMATVANEVFDSALIQVPAESLEWAGFARAPISSDASVNGNSAPFLDDPDTSIVAGPAGVMASSPTMRSTVLWDDVVAVETFPDGARHMYGADGFQVRLEPTLLGKGREVVMSTVDAHLKDALVLPQAARDAGDIPQSAVGSAATIARRKWFGRIGTALFILAWIIIVPRVVGFVMSAGEDTPELWVGSCLAHLDDGVDDDPPLVDCDAPHRAEVFAKFVLPDGPYPGIDEVADVAGSDCKGRFEEFIGRDLGTSELNQYFVYPSEERWETSREVTCLAFADADVTGTLKGANR